MDYSDQNSNQTPNKPIHSQQDTSDSKKVIPTDLDKAAKRLKHYLIICGICGLGLVAILGSAIVAAILRNKNATSGDLTALNPILHAVFFNIFIAIPLGATMGTVAIVQLRKYITNFGKLPKGWLIFGIMGVALCYVPIMITVLIFCFFYILYYIY